MDQKKWIKVSFSFIVRVHVLLLNLSLLM